MGIRSIAFDIFGTVVDWYGTIVSEGTAIDGAVDWPAVANDWLIGYRTRVEDVRKGNRPWRNLDGLQREAFDELATKFGLDRIEPDALKAFRNVWHRLRPWPDTLPGLNRMRPRFVVAGLSNANVLLLADMARQADLQWDTIMSAELVKAYKPADAIYKLTLECLGPEAGQVLYVAAHKWDLQAGQAAGMRAAYVRRWQFGPDGPAPEDPDPNFDLIVDTIEDLATALGV